MTYLQQSALSALATGWRGIGPGQKLPGETSLAAQAGVGRSVVRSLLRNLARDGYLRRRKRNWWVRRRLPLPTGHPEPGVSVRSKKEMVKRRLLACLSEGRWSPGQRIAELSLAREFRVSTGVVREALLELQPLGVFQKKDRYRWSVVSFDDAHIRHLREFREMVEIFALRQLFSRGPAAPLDALAKNCQKTEALLAGRQTTVRAILEVDLEFHRLLLESAGNPLLLDRAGFVYLIIEFQLVSPLFRLERGKYGLRQHVRIHRAIREHRAAAAERELRLHLRAADASFCAIVRKMDRRNSRS